MKYPVLVTEGMTSEYLGEGITFSHSQLAQSSIMLKESVRNLDRFLSFNCKVISHDTLQELLREVPQLTTSEFLKWEDKLIVFCSNPDVTWEDINRLWVLANSLDFTTGIKRVITFNENAKMKMAVIRMKVEQLRIEILHAVNNNKDVLNYFNHNRFMAECKKQKILMSVVKGTVCMEFKIIKLGNESEGFIIYDKIFIFVRDWHIDGFLLRFSDFDFSSYWNIPYILHPYLSVPYGYNHHLQFLPENSYEVYVRAIADEVTKYFPETGFKQVRAIVTDFQELRKYYNGLKYKTENRSELSKLIFNEILKNSA
jgi:hypothetical protein